jgi:hypothetical protein
MIKLLDILMESNQILIPRRSAEERSKNHLITIQKQIQQYIKDGSKGNLYLLKTPITSLPDNLKVGGDLYLFKTKITSLPNNLKVGGNLYLSETPITSLPGDLQVGGVLHLSKTPISKKYSKEQINSMVPGVGGRIHIKN